MAEVRAAEFVWQPLAVRKSAFSEDVGMLPTERDEYAAQLAQYAADKLAEGKGSQASLAESRKVLALALHLSPRNKQAMVINFQLAKGILPEAGTGPDEAEVLAKLLYARALQLQKQDGAENRNLARIFIQLAADLDPKDVDLVYASEINRLDHGPVDWDELINPPQ